MIWLNNATIMEWTEADASTNACSSEVVLCHGEATFLLFLVFIVAKEEVPDVVKINWGHLRLFVVGEKVKV